MKEEYTLNEINNKEKKFAQLIIQIIGVLFLTIAISGCLYDCTNKALKADKYFYKKTYPEKNNDLDSIGQGKNEKEKIGFESAGQFGDLIGGVIGTLFGVIGTGLLLYTLKKQQENFRMERFENRVFELIKFYREIVDEINIQDKRIGKNCFIPMFKEFRSIYFICESVRNRLNYKKDVITDSDLCKIAYSIFFVGIGIESNKLRRAFDDKLKPLLNEIDKEIYTIQIKYSNHKLQGFKPYLHFKNDSFEWKTGKLSEILELHKSATENGNHEFIFEPKYYPYDGHITRLGHYYRHIFEIVRFIVSNEGELLTHEETKTYLKLLRTQMSNHEQLLLYYNAIVDEDSKWLCDTKNNDSNYFITYKMIHNVPFPSADFGIPIEERFAEIIAKNEGYFEWEWSGK